MCWFSLHRVSVTREYFRHLINLGVLDNLPNPCFAGLRFLQVCRRSSEVSRHDLSFKTNRNHFRSSMPSSRYTLAFEREHIHKLPPIGSKIVCALFLFYFNR